MLYDFTKDDIKYVDFIGRKVTINFVDSYVYGLTDTSLSFRTAGEAFTYILMLKEEYDLVLSEGSVRQYVVKK